MKQETFLDGRVTLHLGDCLDALPHIEECSIDSCCTDPPYGINFMGRHWDHGVPGIDYWREVYRVLKPGAHLLAFSGTRTYHRMVCAIEDAGFEIRDQIQWLYGSGFPKSHDVSKGIDRAAGAEREIIGEKASGLSGGSGVTVGRFTDSRNARGLVDVTAPATDAARQWQGWGTALKPAVESICLARKPSPFWDLYGIIGSDIAALESRLWSMLPAKIAEKNFGLNQSEFDAACASAQWNADEKNNTRAGLCEGMDTSRFVLALTSSLSTASSWKSTWAEGSAPENTSITETELSTTIELRTLRFLLSKITPETIIRAHGNGLWSTANASSAVRSFDAAVSRLRGTLELSALAPAISQAADQSLDVGATPNSSPIVLARKPLGKSTVAANVLRFGTGALNIDACRVSSDAPALGDSRGSPEDNRFCTCPSRAGDQTVRTKDNGNLASSALQPHRRTRHSSNDRLSEIGDPQSLGFLGDCRPSFRSDDERTHPGATDGQDVLAGPVDADKSRSHFDEPKYIRDDLSKACPVHSAVNVQQQGRWPANVIHDGSPEVVEAFPETLGVKTGGESTPHTIGSSIPLGGNRSLIGYADGGSAARFFYTSKADADDRLGSKHPTVKPLDLMQYLVRLVTPPGGVVLDLFAGTGTTGEAAWREGMRAVLIEREEEYQGCIRRRMRLAMSGPEERVRESIKASGRAPTIDSLPLFGGEPE